MRILLAHCSWPLLLAPVAAPGWAADDKATVDAVIAPFLKDKDYVGLVVGVTRPDGNQVFAYGEVTLGGKKQPPGPDTVFEIGSISKAFTGVLLASLVVEGKVRLDDPAQQYLPENLKLPRRDNRDITLLHLATHTSGLPVQPPDIVAFAAARQSALVPYGQYRLPDLAKSLAGVTLDRPIGSTFAYSNLGAGLLGHALAHVAEAEKSENLLARRLTGALGMKDTTITLTAEQRARFPPCHNASGKETPPWEFGCLEACGAIRSTVQDLLLFTEANLGRRGPALGPAFQMSHDRWRETGGKGAYHEYVGLCWIHARAANPERHLIWHNGGTYGSRSFLGFMPRSGVGVVLLSNSAHSVDALGFQLLEKLGQAR